VPVCLHDRQIEDWEGALEKEIRHAVVADLRRQKAVKMEKGEEGDRR